MAAPRVTLYLAPGASSLFPHILLEESGIPFTAKRIAIDDPTLEKLNGKKQVPVLFIDDDIVTENPATAQAINQLAPEKKLLGKDPKQFIKVCELMAWVAGPLHAQAWGPYMRPFRFTTEQEGESAVKAKCRETTLERFEFLESQLSDLEDGWALGENFTAVDAYILVFYRIAETRMGLDVKAKYPKWARVAAKLYARESVKRALATEAKMAEEAKAKSS